MHFFYLSSCKSSLFRQANLLSHWLIFWHMGMACSCICGIFLKNVFSWRNFSWTPLPFRMAFQESLSTRFLNRSQSSKVALLLIPLLTFLRIKNSIILWLLCPRRPVTITSPISPSLFRNIRSIRALSRAGSPISCQEIKATSPVVDLYTHNWTVLGWCKRDPTGDSSTENWWRKKEKKSVYVMSKSGNSLNQLAQQHVHSDLWNICGL